MFGWPAGSAEWHAFIEAPHTDDMPRLIEHLGLEEYDPEYGPHRLALEDRWDHPGVAVFQFRELPAAHVVYVGHIRSLMHEWPLPVDYAPYGPYLLRVIVDTRQPPHC